MSTMQPDETSSSSATYRIRVLGHFGHRIRRALAPLEACEEPAGCTVFTGRIPDQAALYGLLRRLEGTGCTLLSVLKVDE